MLYGCARTARLPESAANRNPDCAGGPATFSARASPEPQAVIHFRTAEPG
ncbi:MAG: hypothetical protein M0P22_05650 [Methanoculleus sp.]|nr:hypothetical protein [Methanoculleus sp.]